MHGWIRYSLELVSSGGGGGREKGGKRPGRRGGRDRELVTASHFLYRVLPPSILLCSSAPRLPPFRLIGSENHTWRKRYKIQEIFHDCGHAAIWKTRNPTRLWLYTDMKDKKSYTTVDIHRYERRDILQGCGYIEGLCRSLLKVRWYKTIKGAVWL